MGKSILIMGVGRSGTTAIYSLLQEILEDQYPGDVDYVYEPFLWDRATFNKPYAEVKNDFRFLSAVSLEGMYHNKQIPLLLGDCAAVPPSSKLWLQETLTAKNDKRHYLGKMIRANGRLPLIRELAPETKIIFIIRNPIDVLNSSLQLFSFYGDEFHASDYPRFVENVSTLFQTNLTLTSDSLSKVQSEYFFWLYSNLAFLQNAKLNPENILCIAYETFVAERYSVTESMCRYLGLEFKPDYVQISKNGVGAINQKYSSLTSEEYDFLSGNLKKYQNMLNGLVPLPDSNIEELVVYRRGNEGGGSRIPTGATLVNSMHTNLELARRAQELSESRKAFQDLASDHQDLKEAYSALVNSKRVRFINVLLTPLTFLRERLRRQGAAAIE